MTVDADISLLELQRIIREGVEDAVPEKLWVRAEVAALQSRGHCYLELCQNEEGRLVAKARAVIWKSVWAILQPAFKEATGSDLAPGMQILAQVQPSYSEIYGLSLVIDDIEPQYTLGAAEMEKRKTIELLEKEGLMETQKRLEMSPLPLSLAVISSRTAAGFGDFCRHMDENPYGFKFRVEFFEALMQGEDAPESICEALNDIAGQAGAIEAEDRHAGRGDDCGDRLAGRGDDCGAWQAGRFDAVLILRGGGSPLDLSCFDDYTLAVAIASCPLPVVTAIGHDRDYHVADMVAHDYVKTPTALADYFIDAVAAEDERLSSGAARLRQAVSARLTAASARLGLFASTLRAAAAYRFAAEGSRLELLLERIAGADPRRALGRGFALVTDEKGVVIRSSAAIAPGARLRLLFADGSVEAVSAKSLTDSE